MTNISDVTDVPLPADVTQQRILAYFDTRRGPDGVITMPLRVGVREFGIPDDLALERAVSVRAAKRRDPDNLNDEIGISWEPIDGLQAFPRFSGSIVVWSEESPERCYVELRGSYEPPFGTAGELFDAALGQLIAQRTAHELLRELRSAVLAQQQTPAQT